MFLQIPDMTQAFTDSIPTAREELSELSNLSFDELLSRLASSAVTFAINLAIAIAVFYIGRLIIRKIFHIVSGIFLRRQIDASLATFILSMVNIVLYFILAVTVIGILGIETSSFLALFASAGVAIGMALSGTLQNFAGGVLILLLKPYKIGDYIEAQGYAGFVREIQIFHTVICTGDNKSILIPNGGLSTGAINNWSKEDYRRVDWTISIAYGDDVEVARAKILDIFASDERIVNKYIEDHRKQSGADGGAKTTGPATTQIINPGKIDRSPSVQLSELGASSINLKASAWARSSDYWGVFYSINERIYNELPQSGISFPFPQLDVHLNNK